MFYGICAFLDSIDLPSNCLSQSLWDFFPVEISFDTVKYFIVYIVCIPGKSGLFS